MGTYPRWKYFVLLVSLILGLIYALPMLYGEDPAVQITGLKMEIVDENTLGKVQALLDSAEDKYKSIQLEKQDNSLMVRFYDTETQLKAQDRIKQSLGPNYSVALNLAPVTPYWLQVLGAHPMKLGLDLRGGVHFLMEVDVDSVVARRMDSYYLEIPKLLREAKVHYQKIDRMTPTQFKIIFDNVQERTNGLETLKKNTDEFSFSTVENSTLKESANKESANNTNNAPNNNTTTSNNNNNSKSNNNALLVEMSPQALKELRNDTVEQTISTLRNRVNELGVAEALVQRHGANRIVVELPGIQDTAYAKDILGKTATLKFYMMDETHDVQEVLKGKPVAGSKLFFDREGRPVLVKNQLILTGDSITNATTGQDRDGRPSVNVRLGGDINLFTKTTRDNVGHPIVTVYVESKNGKTEETVINVANITTALGNNFQITGMKQKEARDLSLLLRAGAMPAPVSIVEERIVGPSMGQENIQMGMISMAVGLFLVLAFMAFYYSVFGWIANVALVANLILLTALMSLIGATLTLPGIAGIVLTLGMAVDANVLIFERIREELRLGLTPQASIHRGFEYAFATILDSNLTTLIVAVILFGVGTGPIKGLAVTLSIGILTSLFTGTMGTRALVNLVYGGRTIKRLRVGVNT